MAIIGPEVKDIWVSVKDMMLFFIGYTLFVFIIGQWYTLMFTGHTPVDDLWWYPMYLLILVLVAKIIADYFIKPAKKK